jgi:hypothetical protein
MESPYQSFVEGYKIHGWNSCNVVININQRGWLILPADSLGRACSFKIFPGTAAEGSLCSGAAALYFGTSTFSVTSRS